ncbi:twin-arginine translocation signal domain-containing protein, partial [Streptomyces sp. 2MCAF27]
MSTFHLSRRSVLAGSAAAAAVVSLPTVSGQAQAEAPAAVAKSGYRWRSVAMGGTGFVTGVLFHPSVRGLAYARTDIGGA